MTPLMMSKLIHLVPYVIATSIFLILFIRNKTDQSPLRRPEVIACLLLLLANLVSILRAWVAVSISRTGPEYSLLVILGSLLNIAAWGFLIFAFSRLARVEKPPSSQTTSESDPETFQAWR